jgi:hypothetical protein
MASTTQSLDQGQELDQSPESLAMKSNTLSYVQLFLNQSDPQSFHLIAAEAVKCIINLVVMEVGGRSS